MSNYCQCGCGTTIAENRKFVSGHNLLGLKRTEQYRARIGESQRRAWQTKRQRMPIGSLYTDFHGYTLVKVVEGKGAWKRQHILVMEQHIGRKLSKGEVVHHINGVRSDNRIANLYLCRSHSHHNDVERSLTQVFRELLDEGLVRFNAERGRYEKIL
jgi:hypothetical protein